MQFGSDTTLRLLIVDDSVEAAEAIISGLRNGGIAVRPSRPDGEDDLSEMLSTQPPDLVIAARDARSVPLERVMALVDGSGKDLPVLMLVDAIDDQRL
ncbi:MAG TPA: PAS domain S-box protein, partial [Lysobacter sp.]|nr:PAS domain S-box protein [Lysobacter sp.]